MGAFGDVENFAVEFALRTQINYLQILKLETEEWRRGEGPAVAEGLERTPEELDRQLREINRRIVEIRRKMADLNRGESAPYCCGTQLMNSVLGLLVFPQQQFFDKLGKFHLEESWRREGLGTLAEYVFSCDEQRYKNTYIKWNSKHWCYELEDQSPQNILRHMRNAIGHKRIKFYPEQANGQGEVTHIVFEDEDDRFVDQEFCKIDKNRKKGNARWDPERQKNELEQYITENNFTTPGFKLKIEKSDLDQVLLEISDYFTR